MQGDACAGDTVLLALKSSGLVRHVFRLLDQALRDRRGVPWVLLENVSLHILFALRLS